MNRIFNDSVFLVLQDGIYDVPVILVANKIDQGGDRMVTRDEGQRRFREISCACFHEISVRESVDQVLAVFRDVYRFYRVSTKFPKLKRSSSDVQNGFYSSILSPDSICSLFDSAFRIEKRRSFLIGHVWNEPSPEENDEHRKENDSLETTKNGKLPFRERASTDGTIFSRPKRWKYPTHGTSTTSHQVCGQRRMSISMRGSKASYWNRAPKTHKFTSRKCIYLLNTRTEHIILMFNLYNVNRRWNVEERWIEIV